MGQDWGPGAAPAAKEVRQTMTEDDRDKKLADETSAKEDAGVEIGMGEPNSFEPEEDPDAAPESS